MALKQGRITMRLAVMIPMSISRMAMVRGVIEVSVVSECQHIKTLTTSRTRKAKIAIGGDCNREGLGRQI